MKSKQQHYAYLLRCYGYLSALIKLSLSVRYMTPAQTEQVKRWRRVRRALALDITQVATTLQPIQLDFPKLTPKDDLVAAAYFASQFARFVRPQSNDPLTESAVAPSTLTDRVS